MKGWLKYNDFQQAENLIKDLDNCLGLPTSDGLTITWDIPKSICKIDSASGATDFWGYVVKIDTDQLGDCLTDEQKAQIIQIPDDCLICES